MPRKGTSTLTNDQLRRRIDDAIAAFIEGSTLTPMLSEAVRYAALSPGKRLRPLLACRSAQACGGDPLDAMPACVAVELVHAFSLVHDDLPALDNDDTRRGRPTLHVAMGEPLALLAGDAMLALAHEALLRVDPVPSDALLRPLLGDLSSGTRAMIVGQIHDTLGDFPGSLDDAQRVALVHKNKTGALIRAACVMGARCADAGDNQTQNLAELGTTLGLQFQVIDDLLDVEGDPSRVGKPLNKDQAADKLTYPAVFGIERSKQIRDELSEKTRGLIASLSGETSGLSALVEAMFARDV